MVLCREATGRIEKILQHVLGWVQPCRTQTSESAQSFREVELENEAVHKAWDRWGVPSQTVKAIIKELELEALECRIDGNAGVIAPPRSVVSRVSV